MKQHRFHRPSLLLSCVAAISLAGCDVEDDFDRAADDFELEDDQEPSLDAIQPDGLGLVSEMPDPLAATNIWTSELTAQLSHVGDGDVVMIESLTDGMLGCDGDDVLQIDSTVVNNDGYVWKVHRTDLDGNGTDELQFELIDATGETGRYLKMNSDGEVFCGTITGIGDAAAWSLGATYVSGGSFYRRVVTNIENYKQGECIQISSGAGIGAACTGVPSRTFRIENLTG